jgi:hypothetical protein
VTRAATKPRLESTQRALPLLALIAGLAAVAAVRAAPEVLPPGLRACAQEKDDAQRLVCYDREMARYTVAPEQTFGLSAEKVRKTQHLEPAVTEPQSLSAKVTALAQRPYGQLVFTLDNGQVWVQQEAAESRIKIGDTITLKPGTFGSYFLASPSGRATRVKRVQ